MAINEWGEEVDDDDLNDDKKNTPQAASREDVRGAFVKLLRGEKEPEITKPKAPISPIAPELSPEVLDYIISLLNKVNIEASFNKKGKLAVKYKAGNLAALRINRVLEEYGLSTLKLNAEKIQQLMNDNQKEQEFIKRVRAALAGESLEDDAAPVPVNNEKNDQSPVSSKAVPPPPPTAPALKRVVPPPSDNASTIASIMGKRRGGIAGNDDDAWDENENKRSDKKTTQIKTTEPVQSKADKAAAIAALTQLHKKGSGTKNEVKEQQEKLQNEADLIAHQEQERKILGATVRSDAEKIKKNIKAHLKELHDIVSRYKNVPNDASLEEKGNALINEIEGFRSQLDQKFLLLISGNQNDTAQKIKDDLHLGKLEVTIAEGINAAKQSIKTAKEENERTLKAEQDRQEQARAHRQEAELKRLEDENQRLLQEEKRQRAEKEAKSKLDLEEKTRQEEAKLAKAQEEALKAQKKDLQEQAKALQQADAQSNKEELAGAELRRLSGEHARLEEERERLKKEEAARESEKASKARDQFKLEIKTQELDRAEQDRARAAQQRGLEAERNQTGNTATKPIKGTPFTTERLAKIQKAREEQDKDFADKSEIRRKDRMMGYLNDFGNDKSAIELVLSNRYQGKRTERKLKGVLQNLHLKTGGRVNSHKRNKQISEIATVIHHLQKETALSADEMNNIMRGALQTVMDNIKETEKRNLFTSRLYTECEEMQKSLPHIKEPLEAAASKALYARYTQGGVPAVKSPENNDARQRRL